MKHITVKMLILLMLLGPSALAQDSALENIKIENGWMRGTVVLSYNGEKRKIKVDCALPEAPYPCEVLTVSDRYFSKTDIQRALKAAGQSTKGHFLNSRDSTRYTGNWNARAAAAISKDDAARQAIRIALAYFDALDVEVESTPHRIDRPYDYEEYMEENILRFSHEYSDISYQMRVLPSQWKQTHKYDPKQTAYTRVDFTVMLEGKRLWRQPSYPAGYVDEPHAWSGYFVGAYAIVSDSGILVEAGTSHIPEIKSRRPLKEGELEAFASLLYAHSISPLIAAPNWQSALSLALDRGNRIGYIVSGAEEQSFMNSSMTEPGTIYARQGVITAIQPYLFTISENEWAPFWFIESVEEFEDGWRNTSFW